MDVIPIGPGFGAHRAAERRRRDRFTSTRLAWERLAPARQAKLKDLIVSNSYHYSRDQIDPTLMTREQRDAMPPVRWRMTWHNPTVDRSSLYIASHAGAIDGMGDNDAGRLEAHFRNSESTQLKCSSCVIACGPHASATRS